MSNRAAKLAKQQELERMERKTKIRQLPLSIILGVATLVGGLVAIVTLFPRLTVNVSDPVNPDDPFSSSIVITNTGYIPLDTVHPCIGIGTIGYNGAIDPWTPNRKVTYLTCISKEYWTNNLGIDQKITIAVNEFLQIKAPMDFAHIAVLVDYEIPIIHVKRDKVFPISAKRQTNGKLYWYSMPPD
jgi:hypothetical protein